MSRLRYVIKRVLVAIPTFFGITLLVSLFSHKFSPRIVTAMNRVCGAVVVLYGVKLLADFAMAVL